MMHGRRLATSCAEFTLSVRAPMGGVCRPEQQVRCQSQPIQLLRKRPDNTHPKSGG
jgi:hypothetical protein